MTKPRILVTSAAGNTGFQTTRQLLEKGFPVRALVRRADRRSETLKALGAEIQVGNLQDIEDVRQALKDVQRAYFCAPLLRDALSASAIFASAAQEHGLEVVVALSQWLADPRHPSIHTRETWLADKMFSWMPGVGAVTVNPGWFADNYMAALEPIAQFGMLPMPLGEGLNAPPSNEDIARVIVAALIDPARHIGKRYRPTGPALLSPQDLAATFAKVLGRPVRYYNAPAGMFTKVARALNFPDFTIAQVLCYFDDYQRNAFALGAPTQAVLEVTGQKPEDFETIVRRYVNQSPASQRNATAMLRAVGGMLRIMVTPALQPDRFARSHEFPNLAAPRLAVDSAKWLATHASDPGLGLEQSLAAPLAQ
ncbi:MAG: NmrA family NAD(P)-binding protein [Rhodoferax sp.]|uniref:NmrA family NAD(P)-binding protein n=1 Tax=Rhodoferax sp. TaxID=50421 RepID=UPI0026075036|nr:NmrA family NAD(P)-binding protein [Rhodoferax sp.]MDD5336488.1 NmrA family NAD(P)-binding protein [Rhodoferax sp.]